MNDCILNSRVELQSGSKIRLIAILEEPDKAIGVETTQTIGKAIDALVENIKRQVTEWSVTG